MPKRSIPLLVSSILTFAVCLTVLFSLGLNAVAQTEPNPLAADRLANKLSLITTGRPASRTTINRFRDAVAANPSDFINIYARLIDEQLAKPEYPASIEQLHALWWRIPSGTVAKHAGFVVATDRSYEEIYTRRYLYTDSAMASIYRQLSVNVLTDLPSEPGDMRIVALSPDEPRFRGFFGTPEFLQTYPDTASNVNRKRSSQAFRIAFCETLANNSLDLETLHAHLTPLDEDHGTNPDCLGCHRRLDPMARFFDHWRPPSIDGFFAEYDPAQASDGKVYLGGDSGMQREYPGSGDSDLGALVVQQPEFSSCVANLAWQYVFGREIALDEPTRVQLTAKYNETKRFNSLVKATLRHPYFWSDLEAPAINYANVRPILLGCGGCHMQSMGTQFDPSTYPFKVDNAANLALLKRMWGATNHYAGYRPMPETPRPKLPQESLDVIRAWIMSGGQTIDGIVTLTEDQIEGILQ